MYWVVYGLHKKFETIIDNQLGLWEQWDECGCSEIPVYVHGDNTGQL
jgi:hypothetical protein